MKQEINNESKARFFAQYYGQSIVGFPDKIKSIEGFEIFKRCIPSDFVYDKKARLNLTPLSQISDEDAFEVAEMAVPYTGRYEIIAKKKTSIEFKLPFISGHFQTFPLKGMNIDLNNNECSPIGGNAVRIIDFLRSKSYALPWLGITVEEQIANGWVKLKT